MRIPFVLIDNDGHPMLNQGGNACIQLSNDGAPFTDASGEVVETGSGCYYIDLTPAELRCTYYINIKVTIDGGQMTLIQYTPDVDASKVADAVWSAEQRTLTSLNTNVKKASPFTITASKPPSTAPKKYSGVTTMQIFDKD